MLGTSASKLAPLRRHMPARQQLRVQALTSDATVKVRGRVKNVYEYVSDLGRLSEWEPHTKKVEAGDISAPTLSSYKAERQFATFRVTSKMQVAALKQDQKVVFTESSDFHSATHQYSFLKDPNNDSITLVRYMCDFQLKGLRKSLEPVLKGLIVQLPERSLGNLSKLLNSSSSPLQAMEAQKAAAAAAAAARQLDLLGYYHVLGFDIKSRPSSKISADDVKSAFRVLAKKMHPDTLAAAAAGGAPPDEAAVAAAAAAFQKLQKAYDVLKDPDMRKKYDRGEIKS